MLVFALFANFYGYKNVIEGEIAKYKGAEYSGVDSSLSLQVDLLRQLLTVQQVSHSLSLLKIGQGSFKFHCA